MNIRSMNPSATSTCRHKHKVLESLIADRGSDVPVKFVAITETWLQDHIRDAQLSIKGFNISRCDRGHRSGGGVLLYSHVNYPISGCKTYDDSHCLVLFVKFSTLKLGIFVVYRPPEAPSDKFQCALNFVQKYLTLLKIFIHHCASPTFCYTIIECVFVLCFISRRRH